MHETQLPTGRCLSGVKVGEQVAATDVDKLADGMKVTTAKGGEPGPGTKD